MKTLDLITSGKQTTIFIDKIRFIRSKTSTETFISFGKEHSITAKISYEDLINKIKQF